MRKHREASHSDTLGRDTPYNSTLRRNPRNLLYLPPITIASPINTAVSDTNRWKARLLLPLNIMALPASSDRRECHHLQRDRGVQSSNLRPKTTSY
jgi:hypothetical protein